MKEERDWQPQWLGDYSYINLNYNTLPIATLHTIQYGQALERLIREVFITEPALGSMHTLKADFSDGLLHCITLYRFYQSRASFFTRRRGRGVSSNTDNLPYGVEKITTHIWHKDRDSGGLAKAALCCNTHALLHRLDDMEEAIIREELPTLQPALAGMMSDPYLRWANANMAAYVDIFINNFLGLSQGPTHWRRRVQQTLFHSLDKVFRPCDYVNSAKRKELLLPKKLMEGDCTWLTCKVLLGRVIETVKMALYLLPYREK